MQHYTATYSPEDNKLRLYALHRLDTETYQRVSDAGFRWAPKQDLFVAPAWSPAREDLLLELCDVIDLEDTSVEDRAVERAERFEGYCRISLNLRFGSLNLGHNKCVDVHFAWVSALCRR